MSQRLSARTTVAAVTGRSIGHSLSPLVQNAWLQEARIDAVYVAFPCKAGDFSRLVEGLRGAVVRGLNVTAPFKEEALALSDRASPRARAAGAANLLIFEADGAVTADNTDGEGLLAALTLGASDFRATDGPAVVLGAGGAGRGAAMALLDAGAPTIRIVNRSPERAAALARSLGERAEVFALDAAARAFARAGVVVNTLPPAQAASIGEIAMAGAESSVVVVDMIYEPLVTPLLARARAMNCRTVDGLSMLIGQAAPSFERLFGRPPPNLDVRALAEAALAEAAVGDVR